MEKPWPAKLIILNTPCILGHQKAATRPSSGKTPNMAGRLTNLTSNKTHSTHETSQTNRGLRLAGCRVWAADGSSFLSFFLFFFFCGRHGPKPQESIGSMPLCGVVEQLKASHTARRAFLFQAGLVSQESIKRLESNPWLDGNDGFIISHRRACMHRPPKSQRIRSRLFARNSGKGFASANPSAFRVADIRVLVFFSLSLFLSLFRSALPVTTLSAQFQTRREAGF
ncbi:hypothetical protein BB8028_0005g06780 [Beauveria bassiana]|uniref:Uncharacterized protein n=1 Tax=Beauveria bassiana TaxID=176275 RepID=A0A2S7YGN7_BEABA|nr:hypothetical protein BB8028_0005g06780 [Beauveria bassiana]